MKIDPFEILGKLLAELFTEGLKEFHHQVTRSKEIRGENPKYLDEKEDYNAKPFCATCGTEILKGDKFCSGCGKDLKAYRNIDEIGSADDS